jgi:acetoacetyl-CoA synthetase
MRPIWQPSPQRIDTANLTGFIRAVEDEWRISVGDYPTLYQWSIEEPEQFWTSLWSFVGVSCQQRGDCVLRDGDRMPGARWFPDARLNYAENLLRRRDDTPALIFRGEDCVSRSLSFAELYDDVSRLRRQLQEWGVRAGDRIAGYLPNMPETIVAMLSTTSLGAIWSSCSPDFGVQGAVDRFGQIEPVVLFAADGYRYGGKWWDLTERVEEIRERIPSLQKVVIASYAGADAPAPGVSNAVRYFDALDAFDPEPIAFEAFPFDHPLYILYSSGTTGAPKCIVHRAGGVLLQHLKEHCLQVDLKPNDRFFYFTTCGWMMWNWLVSGLASEATLLLYDGSPFHPDGNVLFDFAESERMKVFGTSAKYIDALAKAEIEPARTHEPGNDAVDGLSVGRRELRLRLFEDQERSLSVVDFGWHGHRRLLRGWQSDRAGLAGRDPGALSRGQGRDLRPKWAIHRRREGRTRLHRPDSIDADRLLERPER